MLNDLLRQYAHTWRVLARLANDFDPSAWLHSGHGAMSPARLSWHILQSQFAYMQNPAPVAFASGRAMQGEWSTTPESDLPTQADVLQALEVLQTATRDWLAARDLGAENPAFPWAGSTHFGVALFTLRHSQYHLGELSALLNESKGGVVEDHYVQAVKG
jgi:hypothetical protein